MSISCLVCLENFESTAEVVSINKCGHVFHLSCLNEWRYSKQSLSNTCPLCRKTYNKRSLTKLFLGVAEPEKDIQKDLQKLEEEKIREKNEKQKYINELEVVKTELGIKEQAYHIIDSVNNEYLQSNQKLKEQNERLLAESNRIKEEMESLKRKLQPPPTVDLTSDISDDEIQFVSATKIPKVVEGVVEINDEDDDDDVQIIQTNQNETSQNNADGSINDFGHSIAPIETIETIPKTTEDVPPSNTPINTIMLDSNEIKNEQTEENGSSTEHAAVAVQSGKSITDLTFGDITTHHHQPQQQQLNSFFSSTVDNNELNAIKKHKLERELEFSEDFSFLRDYFSQT